MISFRVLAFVILTVKGLDCEPVTAGINCTLNLNRLRCELTLPSTNELSEEYELQWYQRYNNDNSSIGTISAVKGKQIKFEMRIQKFDNQTYIYGELFNSKSGEYFATKKYQVIVTNKKKYDVLDTKTYSELKQVNFTCKNDAHSQVGWIEPTGNKISTFNKANYSQVFQKLDDGSMFCCLRYEINDFILTRYVEDITMLMYEKPLNQDNTTTSTTTEQITSTLTSSTTPDANIVKSPRPNGDESTKTPYNHQPSVPTTKPHNANQPKPSEDLEDAQKTDKLNDSPSASDKKKYYVIIASVAGTILVASLIYVIVKKYTRKASAPVDPRNELQLETYASTNVVYAELDIKPDNAPVSATTEDTPYAEIIGVLRPTTEDIKK